MEKVLRCVGNAFLVAVNAFGEIENVIHAYLHDLVSDDHFKKQIYPVIRKINGYGTVYYVL